MNKGKTVFSRRDFIAGGIAVPAVAAGSSPKARKAPSSTSGTHNDSAMIQVDYRKLVSRADLTYEEPVSRSEEGLPVGNGRMGSLVWTLPSALKFQINRADVFAVNRSTNSFPARHTDYASGCGYLDIEFVDFAQDVFTGKAFRQHLSVYDGLVTVEGKGVTARVLAWHRHDVIAVEVNDTRPAAAPIHIDLRMLRYARQYHEGRNYELAQRHTVLIGTRNHTAASRLDAGDGRITLIQEFREEDYYNASAVVVEAIGRKIRQRLDGAFVGGAGQRAVYRPDRERVQLRPPPGCGGVGAEGVGGGHLRRL